VQVSNEIKHGLEENDLEESSEFDRLRETIDGKASVLTKAIGYLKQTFYEGLFHGYSTYILPISTLKAKKLQISFNHGNAWCLVKKSTT